MGSEIEACEVGFMEGLMNILDYFANVYKYFMRYSITIGLGENDCRLRILQVIEYPTLSFLCLESIGGVKEHRMR
jgi:hypothetical protein